MGSFGVGGWNDAGVGYEQLQIAEKYKFAAALREKRGGITCVAVSPDGRLIVPGGEDGTLRFWNVETGKMNWTRSSGKIEKGRIEEVGFVATVGEGKHVCHITRLTTPYHMFRLGE